MIDYGLKGKFALITGGSHWIGLETSIALAKEKGVKALNPFESSNPSLSAHNS